MATTGPFNGLVQGISKIATSTPSALCRACIGGSYERNPNNSVITGISNQRQVIKGLDEITVNVDCIGMAKEDLALWFPTTVGTSMASFPDLLLSVFDGTNGLDWVLTGCQPLSAKVSCGDGPDAMVQISLGIKGVLATEAAGGTGVPVYHSASTQGGFHRKHCTVTYGGVAKQTLSWEFGVDLSTEMYDLMDGKTAGSLSVPTGYIIKSADYSFSCTTAGVFKGDAMDGDGWTPEDIVIALANGTAGQNQTWTLDDFVPSAWNMPFGPEDMIAFAHEFIPGSGTVVNRITVA